jgi:hypothetical protein
LVKSTVVALAQISAMNDDSRLLIVNANVIDRMLILLQGSNSEIIVPTIKVIGNLFLTSDDLVDQLIHLGILQILRPFLQDYRYEVKKTTLWCVRNITVGPERHINKVVESGVFGDILELWRDESAKGIRLECEYCITYASVFPNVSRFRNLIEEDQLLCALVDIIGRSTKDKVIENALVGIGNILLYGDALCSAKQFINPETDEAYPENLYLDQFQMLDGPSKLEPLMEYDLKPFSSSDPIFSRITDLSTTIYNRYFEID